MKKDPAIHKKVAAQKSATPSSLSDLIEFARSVAAQARLTRETAAGLAVSEDKYSATPSDHERVWGIQRGFVSVLAHHKAPENVISGFVLCSYDYLLSDESTFFKRAKYLCAAPQAQFLGNELPKTPPGGPFRPTGSFRRWFRARMTKSTRTNAHLFYSWFQCKRAALPGTNGIVLENLMEHRNAMTANDPATAEDVLEVIDTISPLLNLLKRNLKKDLKAVWTERLPDVPIEYQASRSAAFESSRARGGQAGALSRATGIEPRERERQALIAPRHEGFTIDKYDKFQWVDSFTEVFSDESRLEHQRSLNELNFAEPVVLAEPPIGTRLQEAKKVWLPITSYRPGDHAPDLISMTDKVNVQYSGIGQINVVQSVYTDTDALLRWSDIAMIAERDSVEWNYENNGRVSKQALPHALPARIAVVLEPLKVRTISAGPAATYYLSTLFQKSVHTSLRHLPMFRLIGTTVSPTDLIDIRPEGDDREALGGDGLDWFSADYKSSTDLLSRSLSQACMAQIIDSTSAGHSFMGALQAHVIEYPQVEIPLSQVETTKKIFFAWLSKIGYKKDYSHVRLPGFDPEEAYTTVKALGGLPVPCYELKRYAPDALGVKRPDQHLFRVPTCRQVNAQLMGSKVSFVLLCVANFGLYMTSARRYLSSKGVAWHLPRGARRLAREEGRKIQSWYQRLCRLVLINGDDLLSAMSAEFEAFFRALGDCVGLQMSVGKVYRHRHYANINSVSFWIDVHGKFFDSGNDAKSTVTQIDYLNTGLLFGQNKVLSRTDLDLMPIESEYGRAPHIVVIDWLLQGALPGRRCELLASYLRIHARVIREEARGRNLFIARSLGGWGVKIPAGRFPWETKVTARQQNEVNKRLQHIVLPTPLVRPFLSSIKVEVDPLVRRLPWSYDEKITEPILYLSKVSQPLPAVVDPFIELFSATTMKVLKNRSSDIDEIMEHYENRDAELERQALCERARVVEVVESDDEQSDGEDVDDAVMVEPVLTTWSLSPAAKAYLAEVAASLGD